MFYRLLFFVVLCLGWAATCSATAGLNVLLFPHTGEVRFQNTSASAVPFVYYSIRSPSGMLNTGGWMSIADNHDQSGDGLVDPSSNWSKLSATSTEITEGAIAGAGGSLPAFRSLSLGHIWFPFQYPANDLQIDIFQTDATQLAPLPYGAYQFAVAGDYNSDGVVNTADRSVWRQNFGSATSLAADGNLNGVVDAADYVIWRNNYGQVLPPTGGGGELPLGASIAPEPGTMAMLVGGALGMLLVARGAPRGRRNSRRMGARVAPHRQAV